MAGSDASYFFRLKKYYVTIVALFAMAVGSYFAYKQLLIKRNTALFSVFADMPTSHGTFLAGQQIFNKILVVNFWAPWCSPCLEEIPYFIALQQEFSGKNVQFLGISIDFANNISQFEKKIEINYPLLIAGIDGLALSKAFGNTTKVLPFTVVINKDGDILQTKVGKMSENELRILLTEAISLPN